MRCDKCGFETEIDFAHVCSKQMVSIEQGKLFELQTKLAAVTAERDTSDAERIACGKQLAASEERVKELEEDIEVFMRDDLAQAKMIDDYRGVLKIAKKLIENQAEFFESRNCPAFAERDALAKIEELT